jgi:signal transduction histidine kinase
MTLRFDSIARSGLQFYGTITASVSHELKNALAIIQENAGLLNDYTMVMAKGLPIDGARVQKVVSRIEDQTRRADRIIRNLNQFAHSVDEFETCVDLNAVVALLTTLMHRPAAMRRVNLVRRPAPGPVMLTTAPFLLLSGLGRCLMAGLSAAAPGDDLTISVARAPKGAMVTISPLPGLAELSSEQLGPNVQDPLKEIGAALQLDLSAGSVSITFGDA